MSKRLFFVVIAALLVSSGVASAQNEPSSDAPTALQSTTPDKPPVSKLVRDFGFAIVSIFAVAGASKLQQPDRALDSFRTLAAFKSATEGLPAGPQVFCAVHRAGRFGSWFGTG